MERRRDAPADQRIGLLTARAGAFAATGLLPEQAVAPRTGLTAACAGIEHLLGEHEQARKRLTGALAELPDGAGPEAVALKLELALGSVFAAD